MRGLAVGNAAAVTAMTGTALGYEASATAQGAVALGANSQAGTANSVSVGNASLKRKIVNVADGEVSADSSDAVTGKQLHAVTNSLNGPNVILGQSATTAGGYAIAIGARSSVSTGGGVGGIALGADARAGTPGYSGAMALGGGADASYDGVAVGHDAKAQARASVALGRSSVANVSNTVSVGNDTLKRRIVNVAAGTVASDSNDAITGGQLYRTNQAVTAADSKATAASNVAATASTTAQTAERVATAATARLNSDSMQLGNGATAGTNASAMGKQAAAAGSHSNAIGAYATSGGANAVAMGTYAAGASDSAVAVGNRAGVDATSANSVALGANAKVNANANNAIALGAGSVASAKDTVSVGSASLQRKVVNVADGALSSTSTDAVTGKQLFAATQKLDATDSKLTVTTATANTAKTTAERAGTTATDALTKANALGGLLSQASATASVRLGADNAGTILDVRNKSNAGRVVTGLANGAVTSTSTDAVTGKQLFDQQQSVSANASKIGANESGIAGNQTGIGKNRDDIAGNRSGIGDNRIAIDALRSDFNDYVPELEGVVMFNADRTRVDMEGARVTGLLDGDVSVESKDAVTGGQLFATNHRLGELEATGRHLAIGDTLGSDSASAGVLGVALGASSEASLDSEGAVALGSFAVARGINSVALGRASHVRVDAEEGFALGTRSLVAAKGGIAAGARSQILAGATNSVALGYAAVATEANTISVGDDILKRRIVNVGRGTKDSDATTVAQLKGVLGGLGGGAAMDAAGTIINPRYLIAGSPYSNVGDALSALDSSVLETRDAVDSIDSRLNRMFQEEATARTDGPGRLNLGGAQGMVLGNVANGLIAAGSRDAVNGGQLYATNQQVGQNRDAISGLREELSGVGKNTARSLMKSDGPSVNFGGSRLTGVGAGDISSADSTHAVNGGQLYETNERVSSLQEKKQYIVADFDSESTVAKAGHLAVAIGGDAHALGGATAVGSYSKALGSHSTALGYGAHVTAAAGGGVSVGNAAYVYANEGAAFGASANVSESAVSSVAIGARSTATAQREVSFGNDWLKRRLTNVASGTADHDAATVGQLKRIASAFGGSVEVDANGNPTAPSFNVQGGEYRSVGDALSALDSSVNDTDKSVGALDNRLNRLFQEEATARTDGPGRLNLGGANGIVLGNVANGVISAGSRDAVNGGQLYEVRKDLQGQIDNLADGEKRVAVSGRMAAPAPMSAEGGGDAVASADAPAPTPTPTPTPTPVASEASAPEPVVKAEGDTAVAVGSEGKERSVKHVAKGTADTDAVNVAQLNDVLVRSNEYTDQAVEGLNKRLDGMDKRFNRMAAMSSAQSAMAMNTAGLNTYNRLGAGVGHSDGESALAVGYQRVMNERGSATFSLNGAFTNSGEKTVGVGVGIGW